MNNCWRLYGRYVWRWPGCVHWNKLHNTSPSANPFFKIDFARSQVFKPSIENTSRNFNTCHLLKASQNVKINDEDKLNSPELNNKSNQLNNSDQLNNSGQLNNSEQLNNPELNNKLNQLNNSDQLNDPELNNKLNQLNHSDQLYNPEQLNYPEPNNKSKRKKNDPKSYQQLVLTELRSREEYYNRLDARLDDLDYFQTITDKLVLLGFRKSYYWYRFSIFMYSEEELDCYFQKLEELREFGFDDFLVPVFKPFQKSSCLVDMEQFFGYLETLKTKYGMPANWIIDFAMDDVRSVISKLEMLTSIGFPEKQEWGKYRFLFRLPRKSFQEFCDDLSKSGLCEYTARHIRQHLSENNYGIQNIDLLSKCTGVPVSEIRQLTKYFNHRYVQINSNQLPEHVALMKSFGLTSQDVCKVCCFLDLQYGKLKSVLSKYMKLKNSGVVPWELRVFLSNPSVQYFMGMRMKALETNMKLFRSRMDFPVEVVCPQTFISLLILKPEAFKLLMEKIEILSEILPVEEIITPEGINFLNRLTCKGLALGVKRSESLPEFSIDHLMKSYYYKDVSSIKKEQRKTLCTILKIPYDEVRKVGELFENIENYHPNVAANVEMLQNHGFSFLDIRRLFIVVLANPDKLKHQLDMLSSRPEILASNIPLNSFKALNCLQYFLETTGEKIESQFV